MLTTFVPGVPRLAGELWRIHPHRAGRPARGGAHHVPGRAAHLGKAARRHQHQAAGNRRPAPRAVPPAYAACKPLADKPRSRLEPGRARTFAWHYWLVFRALQNFIGLRRRQVALTGAAPIPPDVVRFFRVLGVPLIEVYGLTESTAWSPATGSTTWSSAPWARPPWAWSTASATRRVADRGDMVFAGYYKNPEATAQSIQDGWLHTGDVVREDSGQTQDRGPPQGHHDHRRRQEPHAVRDREHHEGQPLHQGVHRRGRRAQVRRRAGDDRLRDRGKWAEAQRIAFTHFRSLVETPEVRQLVEQEVATATPSWRRSRRSASSTCSPRSWTTTTARSPPP
jgi:long-chain acyl-CoA synthetase